MGSPVLPRGSLLSTARTGGGNTVCDPISECCTLGWFTLTDGTPSHDSPQDGSSGPPAPSTGEATGAEVDSAEVARFLPKMSLGAVKMGRSCPATACVPFAHCLTGPCRTLSPPFYRGGY